MVVSGIARSSKVVEHSPLKEFVDPTRKKICLLDDNFFGFAGRKDLLLELQATGKPVCLQARFRRAFTRRGAR